MAARFGLVLLGSVFFPLLFVLIRSALRSLPGQRCPEPDAAILAARHWLAAVYPPFAVPYFVYDLFAMFLIHRNRRLLKGHKNRPEPTRNGTGTGTGTGSFLRKEGLMVLHHVTMVTVCFPIATYGRQHTTLHKLNGAVTLLTFLCCRVLLFPFLYGIYGRHIGVPLWRVPFNIPGSYNMAAAALLAPQLYWFGLLCRGAWRLLAPQPPRPP
ncbi:ceramide synthase-like [Coturnix japonica]|uniref:ceramide synthase-like n=1 Tax=Coturnix japonica TaxID=93934 RepID=UPI0013A5EE20|nr:ceramide synthase-like [Coturnix japonica]